MSTFGGKALFLDRSDINTDEIIPAKYLTEVEKKALKPYLLEDLKLDSFSADSPALKDNTVLITRSNFGCGSSREHAVWVFTENNYYVIIAESFARIFKQNAYNNGLLPIELSSDSIEAIFALSKKGEVKIACDLEAQTIKVEAAGQTLSYTFEISPFYKDIVKAGGWINYVDKQY